MSISALSSDQVNDLSQQPQNPFQQIRKDFKQLASALQSGDLADAQSAYSNIQQVLEANPGTPNSSSGSNGSSPLQSDFATLGKALQSGDLSQAQSAFSQLQSDFQSGRPAKAGGAQPAVQDEYVPSAQTASPAQQVQQAYSQLTQAQSAFSQLQSDVHPRHKPTHHSPKPSPQRREPPSKDITIITMGVGPLFRAQLSQVHRRR
jgi:hypothetical protein